MSKTKKKQRFTREDNVVVANAHKTRNTDNLFFFFLINMTTTEIQIIIYQLDWIEKKDEAQQPLLPLKFEPKS